MGSRNNFARKKNMWGEESDLYDEYGRDLQHQQHVENIKKGKLTKKSRGGNFIAEHDNDTWKVTPTRDGAHEIKRIPYNTKPAFSGNSRKSVVPPNYYIKPTPTRKRKK